MGFVRRSTVAHGGLSSLRILLPIALLVPFVYSTHLVSAPPSEAQQRTGAARAPSHPTIQEIEKLAEDAFGVGLRLQFDEANRRFEAALKAAAERFPETHWVVRRVKAKQRCVAHIASLSQSDREAARWADVWFNKAREADDKSLIPVMGECIRLAQESLRQVGSGDTGDRVTLLRWLAAMYRAEQKFDEEERALKEQQSLVRNLYGEGDPEYGYIYSQLATNLGKRGKSSEAEKLFAESRRLLESDVEGKETQRVAASVAEGNYWLDASQPDKAEKAFRAALEQVVESSPDNFQSRANLLTRLALVHSEQGKADLAKRELSEALEVNGKLTTKDHKAEGRFCACVGEVEYDLKRYADAERHLVLALSNLEAVGVVFRWVNGRAEPAEPVEQERIGAALCLLGRVYEDSQQYQKADEALTKALRICRQTHGDSDERTRAVVDILAQVLKKEGKPEESERLLSGSRAP